MTKKRDIIIFQDNNRNVKTTKGPCTNHVDRILGNFDPLPYVDTFT